MCPKTFDAGCCDRVILALCGAGVLTLETLDQAENRRTIGRQRMQRRRSLPMFN